MPDPKVRAWLRAGDPAIRWQVARDLDAAASPVWTAERAQVATSGWGAALLAHRDPEGTWGGGWYTPKWTSTTYTLLLLARMGLPAVGAASDSAVLLLDRGVAADGGANFSVTVRQSETCVTGMLLTIAVAFAPDDARIERIVDNLLAEQMADGGWNCQRQRAGATHASMHTTINVLEGLQAYVDAGGGRAAAVGAAAGAGREFLLAHQLYRSHRTGATIDPRMTRFSFPPRWHYDVLRGLDHFRAAGAVRNERCRAAVDLVRGRCVNGRWPLQNTWPGKVFFPLERGGRPSRWNTLRALRVLRWWQGRS